MIARAVRVDGDGFWLPWSPDLYDCSGDTLCLTHIPSIFRSPLSMLGTEVLVF